MKQYTKASSWRQWHVAVKSGSVGELIFSETRPNTFYVMNPSDGFIYVNLTTSNPSPELYEFEIEPNKADVIGRPTSTQNLYIYNHGSKDSVITVWSYDGPFDIAMLKQFKVDLKSAKFDGVISAFKASASLPYGNNHIGKVTVDNLDEPTDYTTNITALKTELEQQGELIADLRETLQKMSYHHVSRCKTQYVLANNQNTYVTDTLTLREISVHNDTDRFLIVTGYKVVDSEVTTTELFEFRLASKEGISGVEFLGIPVRIKAYFNDTNSENDAFRLDWRAD